MGKRLGENDVDTFDDHEIFGNGALLHLRKDLLSDFKRVDLEIMEKKAGGKKIPQQLQTEWDFLNQLQESIKMAEKNCGEGPHLAFGIKRLPKDQIPSNHGHSQVISIQSNSGALQTFPGVIFSRRRA